MVKESTAALLAFLDKPEPTPLADLPAALRNPNLLAFCCNEGLIEFGGPHAGFVGDADCLRLYVEGGIQWAWLVDPIALQLALPRKMAVRARLTAGGRRQLWLAKESAGDGKKRKKRKAKVKGPSPNEKRNDEWLSEFEAGNLTVKDFAETKGEERSTMSKALKSAKEAREKKLAAK